mgnify:CR=1 FL=1
MQQNTEHQENETIELDLERILQISLQVVKKLWLLILLVVAFFAFAVKARNHFCNWAWPKFAKHIKIFF